MNTDRLSRLCISALAAIATILAFVYFIWVRFYTFFPADILMWAEGDFVNDILKFRTGYPIYSPQANNESYHYFPGAQILTYLLARIVGLDSIPAFRVIQLVFTALAAVIAGLSCRRLVELAVPGKLRNRGLWFTLWLPVLFLAATNSLTNRFVHNLHNDALAQLISAVGFYLLLRYAGSRNNWLLIPMAILPAAGFFVKQSLAVWAILYIVHLAVFDRMWKRAAIFGAGAFGLIGGVYAMSFAWWGGDFVYWVFTVLKTRGSSPLRIAQHLLDVWGYLAIGIGGGLALARVDRRWLLASPWIAWLGLVLSQAYTSGLAWTLNHFGAGSLIATVWLLAAIVVHWPESLDLPEAAARLAIGCLLFSGLAMIRVPLTAFPPEAYRYIAEIQGQFQGTSAKEVLLDAGVWVYLAEQVIMKDRAVPIADRGFAGVGDFSGMIERLQRKRYRKLLIRNLNEPELWYDSALWKKSSGIRQAILANYHTVRTIPAARNPASDRDRAENGYLFSEVTVLEPNAR